MKLFFVFLAWTVAISSAQALEWRVTLGTRAECRPERAGTPWRTAQWYPVAPFGARCGLLPFWGPTRVVVTLGPGTVSPSAANVPLAAPLTIPVGRQSLGLKRRGVK